MTRLVSVALLLLPALTLTAAGCSWGVLVSVSGSLQDGVVFELPEKRKLTHVRVVEYPGKRDSTVSWQLAGKAKLKSFEYGEEIKGMNVDKTAVPLKPRYAYVASVAVGGKFLTPGRIGTGGVAFVILDNGAVRTCRGRDECERLLAPEKLAAVDANTEALGGVAALDDVQTMVKKSLIVEGDYRDIAVFAIDRLGRMRVDIFADGKRVFAESYDGTNGHQWRPKDGQTRASEKGTIALSHTPQLPNHIFRLKDMDANGHILIYVGEAEIEDRRYRVLKLTLSDGFENYLWVDEQTGYVTRVRNTRALHVDIDNDEKVIEARMSDFQPVGNIVHPHRVQEVDIATEEVLVDITLLSLELNQVLRDNYFTDLIRVVPTPSN